MQLGAQLYTLRDYAKDLNGLSECLKRVADIGYQHRAGIRHLRIRAALAQTAARVQRIALCSHPRAAEPCITDATEQTVADHGVFDCRYIGIGSGPNGLAGEDDLKAMIAIARTAGRRMRGARLPADVP